MKKLIIFLISILCINSSLFSQLLGHGTQLDPYRGTINGIENWGPGNPDYPYSNNAVYVGSVSGPTLTINAGGSLTLAAGLEIRMVLSSSYFYIYGEFVMQPQSAATIRRVVNNGILRLNADAYGMSSLIVTQSYTGTGGTTEAQLYLTGGTAGGDNYRWHYVASPVDGVPVSVFTNSPTVFDFAQYVEARVTGEDQETGWVCSDGYLYTGDWDYDYSFSTLERGKGYNYWSSENTIRTISGGLSFSSLSIPLSRINYSYPEYHGWNLVGNPYPSCIDWDVVTESGGIPSGMDNAIYFTINNGFASYVNLVGTGGGTNTIPPTQGFFVKANEPNLFLDLIIDPYSEIRVHNIDQMRYKGEEGSDKSGKVPLVRLKMENASDSDDMVVRFDPEATSAFDKLFDAYKFGKTAKPVNVWSKSGDLNYSINGLAFPETSVEIPVCLNLKSAGIFKLSCNELNKLDDYSVTLKDIITNITVDIKKGDIMVFNSREGTFEDRFVLKIAKLTTNVPEYPEKTKAFSIYSSNGLVNILSLTDEYSGIPSSVTIYDLTGRKLIRLNNVEWNNSGELRQVPFDSSETGFVIIEILAGNKKYVEKLKL